MSTGEIQYNDFVSTYSPWTVISGTVAIDTTSLKLTAASAAPGLVSLALSPAVATPLYITAQISLNETDSFSYIDVFVGADKYSCFPKYQSTSIYLQKNGSNLDNVNDATTAGIYNDMAFRISSAGLFVYRDGVQKLTFNDTSLNNFDKIQLAGSSGVDTHGARYKKVAVCNSYLITCSNLPSGYKFRVGGSGGKVATESGGIATVDCSGLMFPQTTLEVLDGSNTIIDTKTLTNDVWGGDTFTYSP